MDLLSPSLKQARLDETHHVGFSGGSNVFDNGGFYQVNANGDFFAVYTEDGLNQIFAANWASTAPTFKGFSIFHGGNMDADRGDIVISSSGTVYTIDSNVVGNTKLADMGAGTFKGRQSASGTGDPQDIAFAAGSGISLTWNAGGGTLTVDRAALTGDVTAAAGSNATTLASVVTAGGPTGGAATIPVITYDAKGRLTAVTTAAVAIAPANISLASTSRVLGRISPGPGIAEELDGTSLRQILSIPTLTTDNTLPRFDGLDGHFQGSGVTISDTDDLAVPGGITSGGNAVWHAGNVTITAAGKALIDDADAAAQRTTLGLGGAATLSVGTTAGTVAAGDDSRITGAAQKASNLSDLANASTARTNLGLGTAAVANTGTSGGTVPLLNAANTFSATQTLSASLPRLNFKSTALGATTVTGTIGGLLLTSTGATALGKFHPAILWGNESANFTTTNPKLGAVILGEATEAYDGDTKGGMALTFYTTPNVPGTGTALTKAMTLGQDQVATVAAATATPAGGSTAARLLMGTTAGFGIYYGSGAPTVSAAKGSLYLRSDGSTTNNRMYVNTDGGTTWTAVTTAA